MDASFFHHPGFIFGVAAGVSWIAKRLRLPDVLFLLLAGVIFGVGGLGWWSDHASFEFFADVGIAMLLFLVGLEISPTLLREAGMRPLKLFLRTGLVIAIVASIWARSFHIPVLVSIAIGILFAFNSTMLTLKALGDRHETGKMHGRLITSLLIFQDGLAGILLLVASISQVALTDTSWTIVALLYLVKVAALALICWLIAHFWLRKIWRNLAQQTEVFLLAAFAYPLLVGAFFALFGVSSDLGAIMAGLSLAQSDYRYELISRMKPLRAIFLAPFFFLIGLQWSWHEALSVWPMVLLGWLIIGVLGPVSLTYFVYREGYTKLTAATVGLHLSHMSEFVLLFLSIAGTSLGLPRALQTALVSLVMVSMISGAILMQFSPKIIRLMRRYFPEKEQKVIKREHVAKEVILFGCHRVGSDFLPVLHRQKRSFLVVDMDPQVIQDLAARNMDGVFGDLSNQELLQELQIQHSKLIVSTVPELDAQMNLLRYLKRHRAKPVVIMIAHEIQDALDLYKQGASYVILPHFLGGNFASQLLDTNGFDADLFKEERVRHMDHLKRRDRTVAFSPLSKKQVMKKA